MDYKNILIVKLSAIGDVIHALPVSRSLKHCFPQCRITWVVEKPARDLLTGNPDIDEIIVFDKPKFKSFSGLLTHGAAFARMLKSRNFDLALDLQGLFKSAAIAYLSGAPKRLGYCNMREMSQLISTPVCGEHQQGHVVDRYLDVVRALGCNVDNIEFPIHITAHEEATAAEIAACTGLSKGSRYAALAPGTNWTTKCWPTAHYAKLADALYDDEIIPVLIGGPADKSLASDISARMNRPPIDLTGKTSLKGLAYIIKQASVFIGGDTGPMHLAAAVGTPVVSLFGPTDPKRNGPYHGRNIVIQVDRPCIECWKRNCQDGCLDKIEVNTVFAAIGKIARQ